MSIKVGEFKNVLNTVKPALSSKDFIPIFSHYCFSEDKVVGYSEPIGIEVEFDSGITGGLKGDTLLSWVNSLPETKEINFDYTDEGVKFTSGKSKLELAKIDSSDFIYNKPNEPKDNIIIDDGFIGGLENCLISVNTNSDNPSMSGITVSRVEDAVFFHSTNGLSISEYSYINDTFELDEPIVLPAQFCNILIKLYNDLKAMSVGLYLSNNFALVKFNGTTNVTLWSKLFDTSNQKLLDFDAEISNALEGFDFQSTFVIDDEFVQTVKRVLNVYGTSTNEAKLVNMQSKGNEITFNVSKSNIQIDETVTVSTKQPVVSAIIDLEKLGNTLRSGYNMGMLKNLVLVTHDQFTYLQAFKHD